MVYSCFFQNQSVVDTLQKKIGIAHRLHSKLQEDLQKLPPLWPSQLCTAASAHEKFSSLPTAIRTLPWKFGAKVKLKTKEHKTSRNKLHPWTETSSNQCLKVEKSHSESTNQTKYNHTSDALSTLGVARDFARAPLQQHGDPQQSGASVPVGQSARKRETHWLWVKNTGYPKKKIISPCENPNSWWTGTVFRFDILWVTENMLCETKNMLCETQNMLYANTYHISKNDLTFHEWNLHFGTLRNLTFHEWNLHFGTSRNLTFHEWNLHFGTSRNLTFHEWNLHFGTSWNLTFHEWNLHFGTSRKLTFHERNLHFGTSRNLTFHEWNLHFGTSQNLTFHEWNLHFGTSRNLTFHEWNLHFGTSRNLTFHEWNLDFGTSRNLTFHEWNLDFGTSRNLTFHEWNLDFGTSRNLTFHEWNLHFGPLGT